MSVMSAVSSVSVVGVAVLKSTVAVPFWLSVSPVFHVTAAVAVLVVAAFACASVSETLYVQLSEPPAATVRLEFWLPVV